MSESSAGPERLEDRVRRGLVSGFLWASASALGAAVLYPVLRFISPPRIPESVGNRVSGGKVSEMTGVTWKIVPFGQDPVILIQPTAGEFRAFSATCTHLDCTVQFDEKTDRIWCPCHNGYYDLEGRNVAGPPPHPLEVLSVQLVGDDIFIVRG